MIIFLTLAYSNLLASGLRIYKTLCEMRNFEGGGDLNVDYDNSNS